MAGDAEQLGQVHVEKAQKGLKSASFRSPFASSETPFDVVFLADCDRQVKERCQKGIPPSLRGRAWLYLTGAKVKREQNKGKFQVSCPSRLCGLQPLAAVAQQ